MINKKYLFFIAAMILLSLSSVSCDNDANGQDVNESVDFLQNVISGSVIANTQDGDVILQLQLSPVTTYISESPGFEAGVIITENFFEMFSGIFNDLVPNSVLAFRENGTAVSVPIALKDPAYDPETNTVEYTATPLEITPATNFSGMSIVSRSIEDLESPFGPAFLFIDSGSITSFGGTCGDGANLVCPISIDGTACINTNTIGPQCCIITSGTPCSDCNCI